MKCPKWSKERVFEESKKYDRRVDFQKKSPVAYNKAYRLKWLDEMVWLKPLLKTWNRENVFEESKKYNSRTEFAKNSTHAYHISLRNGWLDEMVWLKPLVKKYLYCVYAYVDDEDMVAYVGLTKDKEERHNVHRTGLYCGQKNSSSVFGYFSSIGKSVPEPIYLQENLSSTEAKIKEDEWLNFYKEHGYRMLNKAKTGLYSGSIGGSLKWTKNKVIEESKKYRSRLEFARGCKTAYNKSLQNGWLGEMAWLEMKKTIWSDELAIDESRKFEFMDDFRRKSIGAYAYSKKHGLLEMMDWLKPKQMKWSDELVMEESKKYETIGEFRRKSIGAYAYSKRHGLLDSFIWLKK